VLQAGELGFVVQPGAGIDFWITRALGIRLGADYQHLISSGEPFHGVRTHVGIAIAGGRRQDVAYENDRRGTSS
jgi:hypothetical protein